MLQKCVCVRLVFAFFDLPMNPSNKPNDRCSRPRRGEGSLELWNPIWAGRQAGRHLRSSAASCRLHPQTNRLHGTEHTRRPCMIRIQARIVTSRVVAPTGRGYFTFTPVSVSVSVSPQCKLLLQKTMRAVRGRPLVQRSSRRVVVSLRGRPVA